jgi:hypothetical protein
MSLKFLKILLLLVFLTLLNPFNCPAQKSGKSVLPRVGTIKDYPATGLMVGCGNSYYYFAHHVQTPYNAEDFVFLSNGDGRRAFMNLNGRDTALTFIKHVVIKQQSYRTYYRWRKVSIIVSVEFPPEDKPYVAEDSENKMKIILRQGRSVKTIQAVGSADC